MAALLLVFFASMIGRVNAWLGPNGEGLMDAFNPADLHIAAQPMGEATSEDVEQLIRQYTGITDQYMLAMPSVSAQGVDYTANVITQPERFHMLDGRSCENPDEVVLTEFAAADLGVSVGDTITLTGNLNSSEFTVSGIYQCANDMGANLGLSREGYNRISAERGKYLVYPLLSGGRKPPAQRSCRLWRIPLAGMFIYMKIHGRGFTEFCPPCSF